MDKSRQQTAVEWLEARVAERIYNNQMESPHWHLTQFIKDFEEAKQMEKEQIMEAYVDGYEYAGFAADSEHYYNENYGNNTKTK